MAFFKADIDTGDINRTIGDIRKYSGRTVLRIEEAVNKSVKAISRRAKQNAPRGRTGKLCKSIRSMLMERNKWGPEGWSYVRGGKSGAPHAHLVELGARASTAAPKYKKAMTVLSRGTFIGPLQRHYRGFAVSANIPARRGQPFLAPAYEEERQNTIARIEDAITPKKRIKS